MKINMAVASVMFALVANATEPPFEASHRPEAGMVPDAATAIRIAEAVWLPVFGAADKNRPSMAELKDGIWYVRGTLPKGARGGVPYARIDKKTGAVLGIAHTQ
jgi:hypothetical protein